MPVIRGSVYSDIRSIPRTVFFYKPQQIRWIIDKKIYKSNNGKPNEYYMNNNDYNNTIT